ncbi:hypothetical protein BDY24DRAFT_259749 [Mrakia frigida]|uniref:uncharacterized protein n=1 Tax=Mrakia frigida TaxID=29902 RepID=UPI003FCC0786
MPLPFSTTPIFAIHSDGFHLQPFWGLHLFLSTFLPSVLLFVVGSAVVYQGEQSSRGYWIILASLPVAGVCWLVVRWKGRREREEIARAEGSEEELLKGGRAGGG